MRVERQEMDEGKERNASEMGGEMVAQLWWWVGEDSIEGGTCEILSTNIAAMKVLEYKCDLKVHLISVFGQCFSNGFASDPD